MVPSLLESPRLSLRLRDSMRTIQDEECRLNLTIHKVVHKRELLSFWTPRNDIILADR